MNRRYLTPIIIFLSVAFSVASLIAATVRGRVIDGESQPLPAAAVALMTLPDSTLVTSMMTGDNGQYFFALKDTGRFAVKALMTGMEPASASFTITSTEDTVQLPDIKLYDESTMLTEIVVKGIKAAVVVKNDTIEFNADSYHTTDNAVVEDLLKKLPGVEVDSEGKITSNGKSVSKILINGKEFFADDPKMATKNLSAKVVSKVQVVDRKSEEARLTGVDDGEEETVINLTIKKGMEDSWFGTVKGGYGTDGRYAGNFSVSNMTDNNMVTFIGSANNTNNAGFTDTGRGSFTSVGDDGGITSTQMGGINFNVGNGEKFRVGGDVSYNHSDRDVRTESETMQLLSDAVQYQTSESKTREQAHNVRANLRMRWNIDDYNTLDFQPTFNYNTRDTRSSSESLLTDGDDARTRINSQVRDNSNNGDSWNLGGNLTYVHRFAKKPGRSFSVMGAYTYSDTEQHNTSWSDVQKFLTGSTSTTFRYTDRHTWNTNLRGRVTWTEPVGSPGNYLEMSYQINYKTSNSDKLVYNLPETLFDGSVPVFFGTPEGAEYAENLSNRFRNDFLTHAIRLGYKRTTRSYNINAGVELRPSTSKSIDLINSDRNIASRTVWNYAPYLRMRFKFNKTTSLMVRYSSYSAQPSMTQLQPVPDESNPMNIKVGNPDLNPSFTQRLNLRFGGFEEESQRSYSAMLSGTYVINNIVSRTITDPQTGARTSTYANTSGDYGINFMGMFNQPFRNRNWRFFLNLDGLYNSYNGYINDAYNVSGNLSLRPKAGITFSNEVIQISANPMYRWQLATNTLANQENRSTHYYGFNADLTLTLPFGLQFGTDLNYSKSTGLSDGFDSSAWIWNANLQYNIPKVKGLSIYVEAHDLLGDTKNITRTVSAASISDKRFNNLSRYFLFGISWQFNSATGKKAQEKMRENFDGPMPPADNMRPSGAPRNGGGMRGGFGGPGGRPF